MQAKSSKNTASWTASSAVSRTVKVVVYDNDSGKKVQKELVLTIKEPSKEIKVDLESDIPANNIVVGDKVNFTAKATGGSGKYSYEFLLYNSSSGSTNVMQAKSSKNTASWTASSAVSRTVKVVVLDTETKKVGEKEIKLTIKEKSKTFSLSTKDTPFENRYVNYSDYSEDTRQTYLIQSYLDFLDENKGGTIILKNGDWNIQKTVYVPSNVTIEFEDGVNITKKGSTTALFVLVSKKNSSVDNYAKKYDGASNISFKSKGKCSISIDVANGVAFYLGHNKDVSIEGLKINLNGKESKAVSTMSTSGLSLNNCEINGTQNEKTYGVEIETLAKNNEKPVKWAAMDDTPCKDISISNVSFSTLNMATYSANYVDDIYHENIQINNCTIDDTTNDAIRMTNWSNPQVKDNKFRKIGADFENNSFDKYCLRVRGVTNPTIIGNHFQNVENTLTISFLKGKDQQVTKNSISEEKIKEILENNSIESSNCWYILQKESEDDTEKYHYYPDSTVNYIANVDSKPYRNLYTKYDEASRHYYMLRSYLEQIERNGGGTLTLSPGKYLINDALCVPSNTTIKLSEDTNIQYTGKGGTIFDFVNPSTIRNGEKYSGYGGVKSSKIIGSEDGSSKINMDGIYGTAVSIAHTSDISIEKIQFLNMNGSTHFIELDASKNTVIKNNIFSGCSDMSLIKEAINLDIPDKATGGYESDFTSYDKTPNTDITIQDNVFEKIPVGLGTHMYTEGSAHTNVSVIGNKFSECKYYGVHVMNWDNPKIEGNEFIDSKEAVGINMDGVKNPAIVNNSFSNLGSIAYIQPVYYDDSYSEELQKYKPVYNDISEKNKNNLIYDNHVDEMNDKYIYFCNEINGKYEKWYDENSGVTEFEIGLDTEPYMNKYTNLSTYNEKTKPYYVLRSYLEHIESLGGGTLTILPGKYMISNILCIPSNTNIILQEGSELINTTDTGSSMSGNSTMIQLVNSKDVGNDFDGYSSASNITISGKGIMNLNNIENSTGILFRQNEQVKINEITFLGGNNKSYLLLNSSKDVEVADCNFDGSENSGYLNGIRLTTLYKNLSCENVMIERCRFVNLFQGISTSDDVQDVYHTGLAISNNTFDSCRSQSIYALGWKTPLLIGNEFKNMPTSKRALYMMGMINPEIAENTFSTIDKPVSILTNSVWKENEISTVLKSKLIEENIFMNINFPYIEFKLNESTNLETWKLETNN